MSTFLDELRKKAKIEMSGSEIMGLNDKISSTDLCAISAKLGGVTINEFEKVTVNDRKTQEPKDVYVITFTEPELKGRYHMGGYAINKLIDFSILTAKSNGIPEEDLKTALKGLSFKIEETKTKDGNTFYNVEVI